MSAFEELGVMPEVIRAVDDLGWLLPTPVQAEAIPLILGGGDVLAAAETGSGKTGAFALPIIQIVHETLLEGPSKPRPKEDAGNGDSGGIKPCAMSLEDRDAQFAIAPDGLLTQARMERAWAGARASVGLSKGKHYYEATVTDEGLCRVGWSTTAAKLDLGTCAHGYGFGGTGKKSNNRQFDTYGEAFGINDVIGCLIDLDDHTITWTKNGVDLGKAYDIPKKHFNSAFYPAVVLKNAEMRFNFGSQPFKFQPPAGYKGVDEAGAGERSTTGAQGGNIVRTGTSPIALILEPSRELAEQTHDAIVQFSKHLGASKPKSVLLLGGVKPQEQLKQLKGGVDIITGTPGRVIDFLEGGKFDLNKCQFFVLDEADRLLDTGNYDTIMKMYKMIRRAPDARLQVLLFSATLHAPEITTLSEQIMKFPVWVDLKGKDSVPDTVHHMLIHVDPNNSAGYSPGDQKIRTDGVHTKDNASNLQTPEGKSEAIKLKKAVALLSVIDALKMDHCMIFVRTKVDADNLENFLIAKSGGSKFRPGMEKGLEAEYSCVVLHGDRPPHERKSNFAAFKTGDVRFLICTDVAARGLDISGLPFMINYTLPDKSEDYVHRVGRVGRAETMGLAISLVSKVKEKVWYHSCPSRGKKCNNTKLKNQGGCTIWYDEPQFIKDIETRIHATIPEFDIKKLRAEGGTAQYGQAKGAGGANAQFESHFALLKPTVAELAILEKQAQDSYLSLRYGR